MASVILEEWPLVQLWRRGLNLTDPRQGSGRENSTSIKVGSAGATNTASVAALFVTFVPTLVYAAICIIIFVVLRRKLLRVYSPRTFLSSLQEHERTAEQRKGWFNWFMPFWKTPDTDILNHSSLDGYLFLRYIRMLVLLCVSGLVITWPLLLPLHSYGGLGSKQLDKLTFGNVEKPSWLYVHAFLAWIFFGHILYTVTRECVFFINLRQAYLFSPYYAERLSSRTVLFTCVPERILDEKKLRRIFGDTVKNVWIPIDTEELEELVKERAQTATRLERAEIELMRTANKAYQLAQKNGHPGIKSTHGPSSSSASEQDAKLGVFETANSAPRTSEKDVKMDIMETANSARSSGGSSKDIELKDVDAIESSKSPREFVRSGQNPMEKANYGLEASISDVRGSVAAQWIGAELRPFHRPIANYGRRVDTIRWTRNRLKQLGPKISKLRREYRKGRGDPIPAAFIEFHSLVDAQSAYQTLAHHSANHMRPEIVGVRPEEIYWPALNFRWWERIIRGFAIQGVIAAMVIFWALPSALIGTISNIESLTTMLPWLSWINKLPKIILGLISGLLPAVALSLLMSSVPMIIRLCGRQAGIPTESRLELFVQSAYFVFQVVQVFLITTISSAASAALKSILEDPPSIRSLLGQNIPKASNFYVSYFILQGLAMSATRMVHLGSIFRHQLMAKSGNPKLMSARYHRLRKIHWGSVYPVFTNMGVIAISYSLIAPIVLGVAAIGLGLVYVSYKYNLLYVYSSERDTRGLHYPRALMHTITGLYLAEICLVGLFTVKTAYGPVVLMLGLVIFTTLVQFSLADALIPLMDNLPRTLAAEEELLKAGNSLYDAENLSDKRDAEIHDAEDADCGYDSDFDPGNPNEVSHGEQTTRGVDLPVEGADRALNLTTTTLRSAARKKWAASSIPAFITKIDFWSYWITPPRDSKPNFAIKFLHPEIFEDYHTLRSQIPSYLLRVQYHYDEGVLKDAYAPPSLRNKSPRIWIPRDMAGVSRQEVAHSSKVVEISDEDAWMYENGSIDVALESETGRWVLRDWEKVRF